MSDELSQALIPLVYSLLSLCSIGTVYLMFRLFGLGSAQKIEVSGKVATTTAGTVEQRSADNHYTKSAAEETAKGVIKSAELALKAEEVRLKTAQVERETESLRLERLQIERSGLQDAPTTDSQ